MVETFWSKFSAIKNHKHRSDATHPKQGNRRERSGEIETGNPGCNTDDHILWVPVSVATEPTFAAVASAMRYGIGLRFAMSAISKINGVSIRQIVSFRNKALRIPTNKISKARNVRGDLVQRRMSVLISKSDPI